MTAALTLRLRSSSSLSDPGSTIRGPPLRSPMFAGVNISMGARRARLSEAVTGRMCRWKRNIFPGSDLTFCIKIHESFLAKIRRFFGRLPRSGINLRRETIYVGKMCGTPPKRRFLFNNFGNETISKNVAELFLPRDFVHAARETRAAERFHGASAAF